MIKDPATTSAKAFSTPPLLPPDGAGQQLQTSPREEEEDGGRRLKNQRVALATREELARPDVAWPTLLVCVVALSLYLTPFVLVLFWHHPCTWKTIPLSALAVFVSFTPMHDAAHWAVSPKYRWLNELVGHLSGIPSQVPFLGFRYCHLQHHKYTNDPREDPDTWSAFHNSLLHQLLAWATQSHHYVYYYLKHTYMGRRPAWEFWVNLADYVVYLGTIAMVIRAGYLQQFLILALIPRIIGEIALAYSFDYAPHRPNHVFRSDDIYGCTSRISGLYTPDDGVNLSWALLYQNYHNIHHLYPMVPFYRYKPIWDNHREKLIRLGTPFTSWIGPVSYTRTYTPSDVVGDQKNMAD